MKPSPNNVTPARLADETQMERALGYPYPLTHQSFVFDAAHPEKLQLVEKPSHFPDVTGRTPVLAVGSNQSPRQLRRKFVGSEWGTIPTARVHLWDYDTVYSAHVTGYGSIAATLHPMPDTCVALYVNWLTDAQLELMHETELRSENYAYRALTDVRLEAEAGPSLSSVNLYAGNRGAYAPEGDVVPLAEVPAKGRWLKALSQREVLEVVRDQVALGMELEEFVEAAVRNDSQRATFIQALEKTSFRHPHL